MCRLAGDETCRIDRAILRLLKRGLKVADVASHPSVSLHPRQVYRRIERMRESYEILAAREK